MLRRNRLHHVSGAHVLFILGIENPPLPVLHHQFHEPAQVPDVEHAPLVLLLWKKGELHRQLCQKRIIPL